MSGKGETVKYIIDADVSAFIRGLIEADAASKATGASIKKNLGGTNTKKAENNFKDIRKTAQVAASSIRNFGVAMQGFQTTSIIIGVAALSGAVLQLSGALAAAGSTVAILLPILAQGGAASLVFKTGLSGLSEAFKAIQKNDPVAFRQAMVNLGPAAKSAAYAMGGLNKAFNSIKLNTQQALLQGVGSTLLRLGGQVLPTVNAGFQIVGRALNGMFNEAAKVASSPTFTGLLARIFQDTARTVSILSGALQPLFTIFSQLYLITAPYVTLLAQFLVNLATAGAAYLSSAKGQTALNIAIQQGIIAIQQIGSLVGAVFGFLRSIFASSVVSGVSLITTLTQIVNSMTAWVNSAKGQGQLQALFQFTALAIHSVADALGIALRIIFNVIGVIGSLNPGLQELIVSFLTSALTIRPLLTYFSSLYQSIKLVGSVVINSVQQIFVMAKALGALASIGLLVAGGLIFLGAVIGGPLGSALIIVGGIIAAYIILNYLLALASVATVPAVAGVGTAGVVAGGGLTVAATGALLLQAALLPLLLLAAGILVILGMLGVFSSKTGSAAGSATGFGSSLSGLQKQLSAVNGAGNKTSNGGLSALNDSLNQVGDSAVGAQGNLAAFDKMNVLTPTVGNSIAGIPSLPGLGGAAGALPSPSIDTAAFDKSLKDMTNNFDALKGDLGKGMPNPFDTIGKFISSNPVPFLLVFTAIIVVMAIALAVFGLAAIAAFLGVTALQLALFFIVIAVVAAIAIFVLLAQNWSVIWAYMQSVVSGVGRFIGDLFTGIGKFIGDVLIGIGNFFVGIFNGIVDFIRTWGSIVLAVMFLPFSLLPGLIVAFKDQIGTYFTAIWGFIVTVFTPVAGFFADIFGGAWNAIKNAFGAIGGFFQGIWNTITGIFGAIGVTIGNAIGGAFKSVVNAVLDTVAGIVNTVVDLINGAVGLINKLPGVHIDTMPRLTLPRLAKGGLVTSPTIAQLGESGTEAIMPLENNTEWIDKLATKINGSNNTGNSNGSDLIPVTNQKDQSATNHFEINVSGVFATSAQEQKKVADLIMKQINSTMKAKGQQGAF